MLLEADPSPFTRNEADMLEFSRTAKLGFAKPEVWNVEIPFENAPNGHATLMQNFVNAILDGEPLIAPGEEGIHSVELANVILYSSLMDQTVELPMDSAAYEKSSTSSLPNRRSRRRWSRSPTRTSPNRLSGKSRHGKNASNMTPGVRRLARRERVIPSYQVLSRANETISRQKTLKM